MSRLMLALLMTTSLVLTACESVAQFKVVNASSRDVVVWAFRGRCEAPSFHREDYFPQKAVRAGETTSYGAIVTGEGPGCVQATSREGRLVLSQPYEAGATFTLRDPLYPLAIQGASPDHVPTTSFFQYQRESFRESPPGSRSWSRWSSLL